MTPKPKAVDKSYSRLKAKKQKRMKRLLYDALNAMLEKQKAP